MMYTKTDSEPESSEPEIKTIYWDPVKLECVEECQDETVLALSEEVCLSACPGQNEYASDGKCACTVDAALSGYRCVIPNDNSNCKRRTDSDGTMTCMTESICQGDLKLLDDGYGYTCVSSCPSGKYEEDEETKELRCVDECAGVASEDGLCQEVESPPDNQRNRSGLIAGIVVLVVLVLVAIAVTVALVCMKRK